MPSAAGRSYVPALVYLLGLEPRTATTGSLVIVGASSAIGLLPHLRAGRVRLGQGVVFGLLGVGGAFVGGGFVIVPALVLALNMPMPVAVGTSLVVITVNSASSLVARLGQEIVLDWAVIGSFTAAAVIGSLLGARITVRMAPARLSLACTVLLVAVALYSLPRSLLQLL